MKSNAYLGIDTSNYTTSCAVFIPENKKFISKKQLLPVANGEIGLRQSDAVFHHNKNLPNMLYELLTECNTLSAASVSYAPRDVKGSYMPCFSVGEGYAKVLSAAYTAAFLKFSHQAGHIAAALFSANRLDLFYKPFLAFHISGGTTDMLLVSPREKTIFNIKQIGASLDLKAGQAVDRVGAMLELSFPAGSYLDELSLKSDAKFHINPFFRDGSCSFSGIENKCKDMLLSGCEKQDIAMYCIEYIYKAVKKMTEYALKSYGDMPIVYAGGVMSNTYIRKQIEKDYGGYFADASFSSDNACGTALLGYIKENYHAYA